MKITLLQRDIAWADPEANMQANDRLFSADERSDLYVFPEMFSTGFCTNPEGIAEPAPSRTLAWMEEKAVQHRCAVAGSLAVEEGGRYFNRFYFVFPDGSFAQYDKKHLFTYGGEHLRFTVKTNRYAEDAVFCCHIFPVNLRKRKGGQRRLNMMRCSRRTVLPLPDWTTERK